MKTDRVFRLFVLAAVAILPDNAAEKHRSTSIEPAADAYEGTENALKDVVGASRAVDLERAKTAADAYNRALSRFHTQLARLQIDRRQERGFLPRLASEMSAQLRVAEAVAESGQPTSLNALNEATNHLKAALELINHTAHTDGRLSFKISIRGPESENAGARWWPGHLPPHGADPLSRFR